MIEEIPFSLKLYNRVVIRPAFHRLEYIALIGERAIGIVSYRISDKMRVSRGVGQIVLSVIVVHPSRLKESAGIISSFDRLTTFIQNQELSSTALLAGFPDRDFFLAGGAAFLAMGGIPGTPGGRPIPAGIPPPFRICFIIFCAAENLSTRAFTS